MSNFFEKKNPDATITSLVSRTATVAIISIVWASTHDQFKRLGLIPVSLSITLAVLLTGAIEWQGAPFDSSKKDADKGSVTMTIIGVALIVVGLFQYLRQ